MIHCFIFEYFYVASFLNVGISSDEGSAYVRLFKQMITVDHVEIQELQDELTDGDLNINFDIDNLIYDILDNVDINSASETLKNLDIEDLNAEEVDVKKIDKETDDLIRELANT